jgi:hypothetical protein
MPDNAVLVNTGAATLPEATQQAIKDIFKSLPRFDGTKGFEYYEYDWNSQSFKNLDNVSHPEGLKIAFPKATLVGDPVQDGKPIRTYHVDARFLDIGMFPHIRNINSMALDLNFYYNNFLNSTSSLALDLDYDLGHYDIIPFIIYIGAYSGLHYFIVIITGSEKTAFWILSFNPSNGSLSETMYSGNLSGKRAVQSRIYKYFNNSNNTFEFLFISRNLTSGSFELVRSEINLSDFTINSFTATTLASPQYFTSNVENYIPNKRTFSPMQHYATKNFVYVFDNPAKEVNSQTINDVLLLSFWDPIYNPTEVRIVLVPFSLNVTNSTISYGTPIEKKYNPFSITPKLYKYTVSGEDRIYVKQYNNNYDYFVDNVVSRIDNFLLVLQNFNESSYTFDVVGHKVFSENDDFNFFVNDHSIITLDSCIDSQCNTLYSLYFGVGAFFGYYPVTKKHNRFYFVYVPQVINDGYPSNHVHVNGFSTLVYDLQNFLPGNYQPPTSSTDIPRLSRNPWFVEFVHPGLEKFELSSIDPTYGPIYKNSKKIYLWSNVYVNYPNSGHFSVNIESLFRGDGFFYPRNFLFARNILENFSSVSTTILSSPLSTSSFFYFEDVKNNSSINAAVNYVLKYAHSPDLSSIYFGAIQGGSAFPIAIMSILSENLRVYKWFNIYGNIVFFNTRRAHAPSRGFFSGISLHPPKVYNNDSLKYKKVANFYPLFVIDFPKLFSGHDAAVTFSSYREGKDVKVNVLKSRTISPTSKIAFGFYFQPAPRSRNFEIREFDGTGNFYFNILNTENILFVPNSGENLKVGDSISITADNTTYFYEVVDVDSFSNIYVYPYADTTYTVNVYLVLKK